MNVYLSVMTTTALAAGKLLREMAEAGVTVEEKGSHLDLVTSADRASQAMIRERLLAAFPNFRFVGEEDNLNDAQVGALLSGLAPDEGCFVVDPLDGTMNYVRSLCGYAVSIGLYRNGRCEAGVVYMPAEDELFAAALGEGATLNGHPIHASACAQTADALIAVGLSPADFSARERELQLVTPLWNRCLNVRMLASCARQMAYVAAGRLDAYFEFGPHPWDVAAGLCLLREAGALALTLEGEPYQIGNPSMFFCAPGLRNLLREN